jgi:hypothetical protein
LLKGNQQISLHNRGFLKLMGSGLNDVGPITFKSGLLNHESCALALSFCSSHYASAGYRALLVCSHLGSRKPDPRAGAGDEAKSKTEK